MFAWNYIAINENMRFAFEKVMGVRALSALTLLVLLQIYTFVCYPGTQKINTGSSKLRVTKCR
jgi:hypothetical protein